MGLETLLLGVDEVVFPARGWRVAPSSGDSGEGHRTGAVSVREGSGW